MKLLLFIILQSLTIFATFIFFSTNTIYTLLSVILVVLLLAIFLLLLGLEFFAILYILIYVGVIAVFFVFVIMLVNLRTETDTITTLSALTVVLVIFFGLIFNVIIQYWVDTDLSHLNKIIVIDSTTENSFWYSDLLSHIDIKSVGFFMFGQHGILVVILGLILLVTLVGSLNIVSLTRRFTKRDVS